ncbi:antibiotic biosynthesis monooxygenase [Labedella endophytica]|uniref:Antibiotic biosynthesis monooxygenase n=1 Tax=Labedella endophytica TaxID=1523160 RepID=A0A3S0VDD5_9MICO|nr:antibiotic biosynthesis monooxygenase [Labedella endophytica]RUR03450.1 antibiotic biosynthesis monooxygenase [Labedella endophytica]
MAQPITVSIERAVDPARITEATAWVQAGIQLANKHPGFLGSGWVRAGDDSWTWHMLYRFSDEQTLTTWEHSPERQWWLGTGRDFATESRVERRTGIEGWFDQPVGRSVDVGAPETGSTASPPTGSIGTVAVPPRWKQAVSIWLGFFPVNLVFSLLVAFLPGWEDVAVLWRVLITTLVLTPIMTFWVLPAVTRLIRPWLQRP